MSGHAKAEGVLLRSPEGVSQATSSARGNVLREVARNRSPVHHHVSTRLPAGRRPACATQSTLAEPTFASSASCSAGVGKWKALRHEMRPQISGHLPPAVNRAGKD